MHLNMVWRCNGIDLDLHGTYYPNRPGTLLDRLELVEVRVGRHDVLPVLAEEVAEEARKALVAEAVGVKV